MKRCNRLLVVFGRNFSEKRQIWVSEPHFAEVRVDLGWWLVGKPMVDSLFVLIEHFRCYGSRVMRRNAYSSAVFPVGFGLFALKFYLNMVVPINYSWRQKTRHWATRWRRPHPSYSFWHNTEVWQTDGQIDWRTDLP